MTGLNLVGIDQPALDQHLLEAEEPFPIIGAREIDTGRQHLAREARHVDVPGAGRAHGAVHRHHAALPAGMEHRLVRLRLDLAEAVHAAHVVHTVHGRSLWYLALRQSGEPGADHRVAGDQIGQPVLAPAVGSGGPHRQDQKAGLGGRVPHADLGVRGQPHAEIGEHAARILDGARAIGRRLVPDRRQAEHFPWIAGAQRAHDHVVDLLRVLDRHEMVADAADMAKRRDRGGAVREEMALELGISPGLRDDARAVARADLGLVSLDDQIERLGIDITFLGQNRFQGAHAELHLTELGAVVIVMMMIVAFAAHGANLADARGLAYPVRSTRTKSGAGFRRNMRRRRHRKGPSLRRERSKRSTSRKSSTKPLDPCASAASPLAPVARLASPTAPAGCRSWVIQPKPAGRKAPSQRNSSAIATLAGCSDGARSMRTVSPRSASISEVSMSPPWIPCRRSSWSNVPSG